MQIKNNKSEVFSIIKNHPKGNIEEKHFKKRFPDLYQDVLSWSFPNDFKWTQKLYHYFNDDPELKLGKCKICSKPVKYISFGYGYNTYCNKCSSKDSKIQEKRKNTICINLNKNIDASQINVGSNISKEELLNICKLHPKGNTQEYIFKNKYTYHYIQLNLWSFPKDFSFTQKLYHYLHNDKELKIGICPISKERCSFLTINKGYSKYASIKYSRMDSEVMKKFEQTCINVYGVKNPFQAEICKEKAKQTTIEHYGTEYYAQSESYKDSYYDIILPKIEQSMINKFGKRSYAQTLDCAKLRCKRQSYNNITFDSSWEIIVYKYCEKNSIPCEYQPNVIFEYICDGVVHYYHPDFLINGKLYEVKGEQFFDGDKMINPYDRTQDNLFEAKHQCMIKNGIIILRKTDIKKIKERLK